MCNAESQNNYTLTVKEGDSDLLVYLLKDLKITVIL